MQNFTRSAIGLVPGIALFLFGCGGGSGGNSPTAPSTVTLTLSAVSVTMDGQSVADGATLHRSTTAGGSTRFEAHLMNGGNPAAGNEVDMRFARPMGMMNPGGTMRLFDDGTHGDRVANDGVYCYEDTDGTFGFHRMDAAMGEYHYEFWGKGTMGPDSNHMSMTVRLTS